jgi:hypothetical protein
MQENNIQKESRILTNYSSSYCLIVSSGCRKWQSKTFDNVRDKFKESGAETTD